MTSGNLDDIADKLTDRSVQIYLPTCAIQLMILFLVLLAARRDGGGTRSLGFTKLNLNFVLIGLAFFLFAAIVLSLAAVFLQAMGFTDFRDPSILLPVTFGERIVWTLMAGLVAISEEAAFRGYSLTRLESITGSKMLAVVVASLGFAAGHIYQGIGGVAVIFLYGLMFAILFYKTKSIWPGIIAHFLQDLMPIFALDLLRKIQGG